MKKLLTVVLSAVFALALVVGVVPQASMTAHAVDGWGIGMTSPSTTCIEGAKVYFRTALYGLDESEATYQWQVARNMGPDADCVEDGPYVDCFEDEGYDTIDWFVVTATMEKTATGIAAR